MAHARSYQRALAHATGQHSTARTNRHVEANASRFRDCGRREDLYLQPLYHDGVRTSQAIPTVLYEVLVPDPLDPFGFDEDSEFEPIDDEERAALLEDLTDLAEFRESLEPRGFRGVVIPCPDCEEDHYFGWSLLRENLEHILERGEPRVHEPAFEPEVDRYVTWDYARGFVDGLLEGERETTPLRGGWTSPVEAARRLRRALTTRGLTEDEVAAVLSEGGLPPAEPGESS
jgi:hypothetical protein